MPRVSNHKFYTAALQTYGQTPRGVHWLSQKHQTLRFDVILSLLPSSLENITIGDAGCGFGDFYTYLKQKPKEYVGFEIVKEFRTLAQKHTSQTIVLADITQEKLPTKDYYISSGALNILTPFETHQFIANCYKSAKKGFIFNALYGEKSSQTYNYLSKKQLENIAQTLNVKEVVYKEEYLDKDITVGFFK